jgi:hypothetical protein
MNGPVGRVLLIEKHHEICRLHEPPYVWMSIGLRWRKRQTLAIGLVLEIVFAIPADSLGSPRLIRKTALHVGPEVPKGPSNVETIIPEPIKRVLRQPQPG